MSQVRKIEENTAVIQSPDNLLAVALEKGTDIDQLTKLMDLKERFEAMEAKKAFYGALSNFQSMVPTIKKTSRVNYNTSKGVTGYMFAPLGSIAEQIRESMQLCGLSYRFEQNHESGIEVGCIVTHVHGHSEKTVMKAMADQSGGKNAIQAIGSTVTYLQRYTLINALGLTTAEQDIDAQVAISTGDTLTLGQIEMIEASLKNLKKEKGKFLKWLDVEKMEAIPSSYWGKICSALHMENQ